MLAGKFVFSLRVVVFVAHGGRKRETEFPRSIVFVSAQCNVLLESILTVVS